MDKKNNQNDNLMTFGEHLEVFRKMLFRILAVAMIIAIVIFCAKDTTFSLLLAPSGSDFSTYQVIERLAREIGIDFHFEPYHVQLINKETCSPYFFKFTCEFFNL